MNKSKGRRGGIRQGRKEKTLKRKEGRRRYSRVKKGEGKMIKEIIKY